MGVIPLCSKWLWILPQVQLQLQALSVLPDSSLVTPDTLMLLLLGNSPCFPLLEPGVQDLQDSSAFVAVQLLQILAATQIQTSQTRSNVLIPAACSHLSTLLLWQGPSFLQHRKREACS